MQTMLNNPTADGVHQLSCILLTTLKAHSAESKAPVIWPVKDVTVCDCRISGREIQKQEIC